MNRIRAYLTASMVRLYGWRHRPGVLTYAAVVAVGLAVIAPATPSHAVAAADWPAVYIAPHQDDETLLMGASILKHEEAGRPVWIFLATDGAATQACPKVGLDPAACTVERDREFREAAHALGVPDSRIRIATKADGSRYPDGALTYSDARTIVAWAANTVKHANNESPTMSLKAPSWSDDHADHAALGAALRDAQATDVRFMLKDFSNNLAAVPSGTRVITDKPANGAPLSSARDAYKSGYGVGYLSVPAAFDYVVSHPWRRAHTRVGG